MAKISLKTLALAYITTFIVFGAIDSVWLSTMTSLLYRPVMGDMLLPSFRLAPAVIFYLLYIGGLTLMAVRPALIAGGVGAAVRQGAAIGFMSYMTYDLTNHAVMKNWSTLLSVADIVWGTLLSGLASGLATWIVLRFFRTKHH